MKVIRAYYASKTMKRAGNVLLFYCVSSSDDVQS